MSIYDTHITIRRTQMDHAGLAKRHSRNMAAVLCGGVDGR